MLTVFVFEFNGCGGGCRGSSHKLLLHREECSAYSSCYKPAQKLSATAENAAAELMLSVPQPFYERLSFSSSVSLLSLISSFVSSPA